MEAICSAETSVGFQRTTRHYTSIPGNSTVQIRYSSTYQVANAKLTRAIPRVLSTPCIRQVINLLNIVNAKEANVAVRLWSFIREAYSASVSRTVAILAEMFRGFPSPSQQISW
jgi:hypothetical protein